MQLENIKDSEITLKRDLLPTGIYIYQLMDDKGKSKRGKVVIY
jgi:hypothetical protein